MTTTDETAPPARTRDAARTRGALLDAGRRRFADDGYASTTVRDVARDAGVDVALIKRYFGSKEGLFSACLVAAVQDLGETTRSRSPGEVVQRIAGLAVGVDRAADDPRLAAGSQALRLLLRTSGDPGVDARRRDVLQRLATQLARTLRDGDGPARPDDPTDAELVRAQVVLSTAVGIAVLRVSPGLEPLQSATADEIASVLTDLVHVPPSSSSSSSSS